MSRLENSFLLFIRPDYFTFRYSINLVHDCVCEDEGVVRGVVKGVVMGVVRGVVRGVVKGMGRA